MTDHISELTYENRCLRTITGALLFGPSGDRLAVDVLDRKPGFSGSVDFIHKMNITQLFSIATDRREDYRDAKVIWYPTHMTFDYERNGLKLLETKVVLKEDIAVSLLEVENFSGKSIIFSLSCQPEGFQVEKRERKGQPGFCFFAQSPVIRFGISVGIALSWNQTGEQTVLKPGEKKRIISAAYVGNLAVEKENGFWEKLEEFWKKLDLENTEQYLLERNREFYEKVPSFFCDDRLMERCWKYRWYILNNALCKPGYGRFPETVMYEGRDHRMPKTALKPRGWEFSRLIPLSTPLQITDFRWYSDKELVKETIRSAFCGQDETGLLLCADVETSAKSYANYMLWAVWLFYLTEPDQDFVHQLLPKMKKYIEGHEKAYQDGKSNLLIERKHSLTGKEYQPSYWYFHDFPKNPKDPAGYTPLKRVDRSIYHYLNLKGLANLMAEVKDPESSVYEEKARALAAEINEKMWDPETGFYYDLHFETEEKAMVQNIVGIYPYWAEIARKDQEKGILPLMDPEKFDLGYAFPSVSKECPAFCPDGGWQGDFLKGRNGCVWCGPSWPYTTAIALEALGNESRREGHRYDEEFDRFLEEYTIEHFREGDPAKPYLVEHYNPISGERLSDEADYNHSFWLDLIVSYVAGVIVEAKQIRFDPIRTHLEWFELDNLMVRGHRLRISYDKNRRDDAAYQVFADGKRIKAGKDGTLCLRL